MKSKAYGKHIVKERNDIRHIRKEICAVFGEPTVFFQKSLAEIETNGVLKKLSESTISKE